MSLSKLSVNEAGPGPSDGLSLMQTAHRSHFYANDITMQSLHSEPLPETGASSKDTVYSKRSRESQSPPPVAKRTQVQQVRQSLADLVFKPIVSARALRSKGPVTDVPYIPFPVESRAYSRELEKQRAADQDVAATPPTQDRVPSPALPPPDA